MPENLSNQPQRNSFRSRSRHLVRGLHRELEKAEGLVLLCLRVAIGVIFVAHGTLKLTDPMGTAQQMAAMGLPFPVVAMLLAVAGEFVGGLGLIVGALTRIAALGPLFTMMTAIFTVHIGHGLFASKGGWEYPLTLFLVSLLFVVRGGGRYSVDSWVRDMRSRGTGRQKAMGPKERKFGALRGPRRNLEDLDGIG